MHPVPAQPACCARLLSKDVHDATRGLLVEVDRIRSRIEHRFVFTATHQLGHARLRSVRTSTSRSEGTAGDSKYTCQDPKQIAIRNHSALHYEAKQTQQHRKPPQDPLGRRGFPLSPPSTWGVWTHWDSRRDHVNYWRYIWCRYPSGRQTRDPATASQDKTRPPAQRRLGKQVWLHPKPSHNIEPSLSLQNNLSRFVDCRCM